MYSFISHIQRSTCQQQGISDSVCFKRDVPSKNVIVELLEVISLHNIIRYGTCASSDSEGTVNLYSVMSFKIACNY